jgi:hypothetical protein
MGRRVNNRFPVWKEVSACRAAALAQLLFVRAVGVHRENLIARARRPRIRLIDQLLSVRRKIRLGVLAARGELFDAGQMPLGRRRLRAREPLHQRGNQYGEHQS